MNDDVLKVILKKYGQGICISANSIVDRKRQIVPTTPALDIALNGGIPEGSWVTLTGREKTGKTTLCLQVAAHCQKSEYGARKVVYLDVEGRLKSMNLQGIKGLDPFKVDVIRSTKDHILTAEDFLDIAENILRSHERCLMIIDSISSLCEAAEMDGEMGTSTRGGGAKLVAQFCRKMSGVVPVMDHIVMCVTHLMANTSGWGASIVEKSGNEIKYQVDVKLRIENVKPWLLGDKDNGKRIGQTVSWLVECSALGSPGNKADCRLRYGEGFDEVMELIGISVDFGIISRAGGGWHTWFDDTKIQGEEQFYNFLMEDPARVIQLKTEVYKMLGLTYESVGA